MTDTLPMSKKYSLSLIDYAHEVKAEKTQTDDELMRELKNEYMAMCGKYKIEGAAEFWEGFEKELLVRPHLARFTKDARGCSSRFFPRWVMDIINKLMSRTMFPAYFKGYTIENKLEEIPKDDPFYIWSEQDPIFVYVRERDKLANTAMQRTGVERILNPGAGNCPEIFELPYDRKLLEKQDIRCCDIADTGVQQKLEKLDLPTFTYEYMDMAQFIQQQAAFQPNLAIMKGTLSYQMSALPQVLTLASQLLAPGGTLFFDLQLVHWAFLRNLETFTWGEGTFGLLESPEAATSLVRKVVKDGKLPFSLDEDPQKWSTAFYDAEDAPVGIAFELKKVA